MGIIARYDGRLYAQIKDRNGKWVKRSLDTKDRVVARAKYRELERLEGDPTYRAANETSFGTACDDFVASRRRKGCSAETISFYDKKLKSLKDIIGEDIPLSRIDAPLVDAFTDARLEDHASRNTIGKELGALRGVLKTARRAGKFLSGIDTVMPAEWSDEYEPRSRALTPDEVRRLLVELARPVLKKDRWGKVRAAMGRERNSINQAAACAYMVATGARLGEMRRAERAHIRLEAGLVFMSVTKTRRKGVKDRFVPITPLTRELLETVLQATVGRTGKMFDTWGNVGRDLKDACIRAGIERCSPNDLRRTHGTWLRNVGVEPTLIGAALGHKDSRMVERVYGRLAPEKLLALLLERTNPPVSLPEPDRDTKGTRRREKGPSDGKPRRSRPSKTP